jgi:hypothetical protein
VGPFRGRVCDDLDARLPRGLHESDGPALDVQGEWRVLNLDGRDGVGACALRRAKAEILEGPRCLFNLLGSRKDEHPDLIEQRLLS